jgi:hypothetical protein
MGNNRASVLLDISKATWGKVVPIPSFWLDKVNIFENEYIYNIYEIIYMGVYSINNLLYYNQYGNIGIGTSNGNYILDLSNQTDGLMVPSGTTNQRPSNPVKGMIRYNTTISRIEIYINTWTTLDDDYNILSDVNPKLLTTDVSTAVITGQDFTTDILLKLLGRNGVYIPITTWTLNSSTQITFYRPTDLSFNLQPYTLVAITPDDRMHKLDNVMNVAIDYSTSTTAPIFTSPIPLNIVANSKVSVLTYNYIFTALTSITAPITWSINDTSYCTINSTSGVLTIIFPQGTQNTGTFTVTATNTYGSSTQSWTYDVFNGGVVTDIFPNPLALDVNTETGDYDISYNLLTLGQGDEIVSWSFSPTTFGDVVSYNYLGVVTLHFPRYTIASGTFTVTTTTKYGSYSISWNYNIYHNLYSLSYNDTFTFTNAGRIGSAGPTLAQLRTAYITETWTANSAYLNMTVQGIQEWTVPETASYQFIVAGGAGGNRIIGMGADKGLGAIIRGTLSLTKGQIVKIVVGHQGQNASSSQYGSGGGGGTFVWSGSTLLFVAGGGGGAGAYSNGQNGLGFSATGGVVGSGGTGYYGGNSGRATSGGRGGTARQYNPLEHYPPDIAGGGGGGAWSPDLSGNFVGGGGGNYELKDGIGTGYYGRMGGFGGGGGQGGTTENSYTVFGGAVSTPSNSSAGGGGGGGGYNGGNGGNYQYGGYGGTSYAINGYHDTSTYNDSHGYVTVSII